MKPEVDQEIQDAMKIYKIAGPIIIIILLIGVLYAVFKPEAPAPAPIAPPAPIPEATPEPLPEQTPTPEPSPEATPETSPTPEINATPENITQEITINASATPTPTPQVVNYTWEGITVNFPDSMKRITTSQKSHHYIEILESDNTPITNGEQFELDFTVEDNLGKDTELIATFEANKWLVSLLLTNKGNYTFTIKISCEEQKGHCQRLYPPGNTQKTTTVEVV
jgi:hypothetical protein